MTKKQTNHNFSIARNITEIYIRCQPLYITFIDMRVAYHITKLNNVANCKAIKGIYTRLKVTFKFTNIVQQIQK